MGGGGDEFCGLAVESAARDRFLKGTERNSNRWVKATHSDWRVVECHKTSCAFRLLKLLGSELKIRK